MELPSPRIECARCRRPERLCWCAHLPVLPTQTHVVFLQHPRERNVAIGTARMASLCLPGSELHVGAEFAGSRLLARLLDDRERPAALLYPGEGAIDVSLCPPPGPITLIVVDGTWSHARKLVKTTPELQQLPRYSFVPARPSEYRIRREPDEAYVSTIESLVYVLGALERDPDRFTALLRPFRAMVDTQVDHATRIHTPRKRIRAPRPPRARGPAILRERAGDLVLVAGEANSWPFGSPERTDPVGDLVHWTAHRPSNGAWLECIVQPPGPLAPSTPHHIELPAERLASGTSALAFRDAWRAFVKDDDVLCAWGDHSLRLLARAGGFVPTESVDLRRVARVLENRHLGSLDAFGATLPEAPGPGLEGRGGRRLGLLARVLRHVVPTIEASS